MDRRRLRAAARASAMALTGVLIALSCAVAAPASAATSIDCTPMGDPACRTLTPTVACAWTNTDGTHTVVFGYANPSTSTLHIDPGSHNGVSPGADLQGQPLDFAPGVQVSAFYVTVPATTWPSWRLGNSAASSSSATPACPGNPVPMVGSVVALGLGLGVVLLVLLGVLLARPRNIVAPGPREVWS
jgi:hypothetical protein